MIGELACSVCHESAGDCSITMDGKPLCDTCKEVRILNVKLVGDLNQSVRDLWRAVSLGESFAKPLERAEHLMFVVGNELRNKEK